MPRKNRNENHNLKHLSLSVYLKDFGNLMYFQGLHREDIHRVAPLSVSNPIGCEKSCEMFLGSESLTQI